MASSRTLLLLLLCLILAFFPAFSRATLSAYYSFDGELPPPPLRLLFRFLFRFLPSGLSPATTCYIFDLSVFGVLTPVALTRSLIDGLLIRAGGQLGGLSGYCPNVVPRTSSPPLSSINLALLVA
jgi:hypothetical protein